MEGWMIGISIMIIGAIIAIAFIVRNKKNPVGGSKKQQQQDYLNEEQQRHCNKYKKYFDNIPTQYRYKNDKPSGALYDSDRKRIR